VLYQLVKKGKKIKGSKGVILTHMKSILNKRHLGFKNKKEATPQSKAFITPRVCTRGILCNINSNLIFFFRILV